MKKEKFEMLMPEVQQAFTKECKDRKIALIAGWIMAIAAGIAYTIWSRDTKYASEGIGAILWDFYTSLQCFGGIICGMYHLRFLFKKTLYLGILNLVIHTILLGVIWCIGTFLVIADTVLLIIRKPLVYPFEEKRVIGEIREKLGVFENPFISLDAQANHAAAMNKIEELKAMHDKGLITQEEFEAKKAELMSRI